MYGGSTVTELKKKKGGGGSLVKFTDSESLWENLNIL